MPVSEFERAWVEALLAKAAHGKPLTVPDCDGIAFDTIELAGAVARELTRRQAMPMSSLDIMRGRDPAALRPTPNRGGLDQWMTPPCLIAALVERVLPTLDPTLPVYAPAAPSSLSMQARLRLRCRAAAGRYRPPRLPRAGTASRGHGQCLVHESAFQPIGSR
jgi:hypothetical protein